MSSVGALWEEREVGLVIRVTNSSEEDLYVIKECSGRREKGIGPDRWTLTRCLE